MCYHDGLRKDGYASGKKSLSSTTRQLIIDTTLFLETFEIQIYMSRYIGHEFLLCIAKPFFFSKFGLKIFIWWVEVKIVPIYVGGQWGHFTEDGEGPPPLLCLIKNFWYWAFKLDLEFIECFIHVLLKKLSASNGHYSVFAVM